MHINCPTCVLGRVNRIGVVVVEMFLDRIRVIISVLVFLVHFYSGTVV